MSAKASNGFFYLRVDRVPSFCFEVNMVIENDPIWLWISFGRNDLLIEKKFIDWKQWGFSIDGVPALVTPLFTFWPWFSQAKITEEEYRRRIDEMQRSIETLKTKLSK